MDGGGCGEVGGEWGLWREGSEHNKQKFKMTLLLFIVG